MIIYICRLNENEQGLMGLTLKSRKVIFKMKWLVKLGYYTQNGTYRNLGSKLKS